MAEKYSESSAKFGKFVIRIFSKLQAPVFLMSKGKIWNKWPGGFPVMVVKTVGAKTKKVRNIPLIHVHKDGNPILVASLGGMPKNPSWYYNVKANPKIEVMTRNSHGTFIASQVSKEEKLLSKI